MNLALILVAIGNVLLLLGVRSLRTQRLNERHALLFVALGLPFLALAIWPHAVGAIASRLDIDYHTVLLLAVTTFLLLLVFNLLSAVSVLERRIIDLAQRLAILARRLDDVEAGRSAEQPLRLQKKRLRKGA
jgi:hypothetical protein